MNHDVDVLIAGGGPVGLATAMYAARAGLRATVIEPRSGPVDKACGEGLMPGAVVALRDLGVEVVGRDIRGIDYVDDQRRAVADFVGEPGRGVRRTTLHAAMSDRARAQGVEIVTGRVGAVRQVVGGVEVDGRTARYLVAADGLRSPVRAALGLDRSSRRPARFGIRRHYRCEPWTDHVEVHWTADHEVYVTPVADDLVGVAVLGPRGIDVDRALASVPQLAARFATRRTASEDRGAGPLHHPTDTRVAGRVLLVGDAAGYVDAITGEGVRLGIEQAAAAVDCVLAERPEQYDARWRSITARYRVGTGALLAVARRPSARRRIVPAAERFPGVFTRCVHLVAGPAEGAPAR